MAESNPPLVLVVDDDPGIRLLVQDFLELDGYRALCVDGGEAALDAVGARRSEINLVLIDYLMPGMDGLELADRLDELAPEIPILYITAHQLPEDLAPSIISKPFTREQLSSKIRSAISIG